VTDAIELVEPSSELHTIDVDAEIHLRDESRREIAMRVVPWGVTVNGKEGPEEFQSGAFAGIDPAKVVLRLEHENPAAGRGIELEERADGAYMVFKVSKTQRGDEILALASDKVTRGASPGYYDVAGGTEIHYRNGRRTRVVRKADLREVSTTWRPTWEQSAVLFVRSKEEEAAMAEPHIPAEPAAPVPAQVLDIEPLNTAVASMGEMLTRSLGGFADRLEKLEERSRTEIVIPTRTERTADISRGLWMKTVLRALSGEPVPELHERTMADLVTTDNLGVVPEAFSPELIGIIDASRPFLQSTRRIPTPDSGMTLNMPIIVTRPTAGVQVNEKDDITSTATSITSTGFDAVTIAGGGDLSLQILKRSSPSYLDLYLQLLAEALSENAEAEALDALLSASVTPGTGTLDPAALAIGEAWVNARAARQRADTIWLSSDAVAAFIDAKVDGTNAPLYSTLAADITVGGGPGGRLSGLRPVFVPALDDTATDVIIGPSRGFAWAEDGAFTLQTDVPSKAGRDVALVVIDWYAPLYPAAFTTYAV